MPNPPAQKTKEKGAIEIIDGQPIPLKLRLSGLTEAQYQKLVKIASKRKQSIPQVIAGWIDAYQLDPIPYWGASKKNERMPIT